MKWHKCVLWCSTCLVFDNFAALTSYKCSPWHNWHVSQRLILSWENKKKPQCERLWLDAYNKNNVQLLSYQEKWLHVRKKRFLYIYAFYTDYLKERTKWRKSVRMQVITNIVLLSTYSLTVTIQTVLCQHWQTNSVRWCDIHVVCLSCLHHFCWLGSL